MDSFSSAAFRNYNSKVCVGLFTIRPSISRIALSAAIHPEL
jgi:hypothetical protein